MPSFPKQCGHNSWLNVDYVVLIYGITENAKADLLELALVLDLGSATDS